MSEKTRSREAPDHQTRQAAHLRALAANATTGPLKARLAARRKPTPRASSTPSASATRSRAPTSRSGP